MIPPLVTVALPTYNRPDMLRASLASVLQQTYPRLEVIVADNASSTDSAAVIDSFHDARVTLARLATPVPLDDNLTRCLHLGTGRYRTVLPDDDLMLPGNIAQKVALLQAHPDVTMVHSAFRYVDGDGVPYGPGLSWTGLDHDTVQPGLDYVRQSIAHGGITCFAAVMVRSDAVADESFRLAEGPYCDVALWARVALRGEVGFLGTPLSGYRVHPGSASSSLRTLRQLRGRTVLTLQHADAVRQAFEAVLSDHLLPPTTELACRRLLRQSDRRMRAAILANRWLPRPVLAAAKRVVGWDQGTRLHRALSLYSLGDEPGTERGPVADGRSDLGILLPTAERLSAAETRQAS